MKLSDALNTLGIEPNGKIEAEQVFKAYKAAAFKYHPDRNPAGLEMMKLINDARDSLLEMNFPIEVEEGHKVTDYGQEISDALNKIITFVDIEIEICGSWVWVTGETKSYKEQFKEAGFKFSGKKVAWYFRPASDKRRYFGSNKRSMDDIRASYGSSRVKTKAGKRLTA